MLGEEEDVMGEDGEPTGEKVRKPTGEKTRKEMALLAKLGETDGRWLAPDAAFAFAQGARFERPALGAQMLTEALVAGARLNEYKEDGRTAVHLAIEFDRMETLALLLMLGATLRPDARGTTPLMR